MELVVDDLPLRGRDLAIDASTAWASQAAALALDVEASDVSAIGGRLHLQRGRRGEVTVRVDVTASAPHRCDRCGAEATLGVHAVTELLYRPAVVAEDDAAAPKKGGKRPEVALEEEDLDLGWYEGGVIAVDDVLAEALTLALPPRVTCAEMGADVGACDARVESMLSASKVSNGDDGGAGGARSGHPAFAILDKLR